MIGITGFGGYLPQARLSRRTIYEANAWLSPNLISRAKGTRTLANWDEDVITMTVAAARDCLGPGDDRTHVDAVYLASTTAPFADRLNAGIIAAALTLEDDVAGYDLGGARGAGVSALNQAMAHVRGGGRSALVLASDMRKARVASAAEHDQGDGAAALLVGAKDVLAEHIASASMTVDFVDHFRQADAKFDYAWEERWVREEGILKIVPQAIKAVMEKAGITAESADHLIFPSIFPKIEKVIAGKCGMRPEIAASSLMDEIGDIGSGHALLMLAHTLERAKPGELILVVDFSYGAETILFRVTDAITSFRPQQGVSGWLSRGREEPNYMKLLAYRGLIEIEKGARGEQDKKTALSTLYRHRRTILGFVGGKCSVSGSVQFPPSRLAYDQRSGNVDTLVPYKMADRQGIILSWSAESLSFYLSPPHHYGQIDFVGGGRVLMEFTDVRPGDVEVGVKVEMVFRIKDRDMQRDFTRYFWKAVPVLQSA